MDSIAFVLVVFKESTVNTACLIIVHYHIINLAIIFILCDLA